MIGILVTLWNKLHEVAVYSNILNLGIYGARTFYGYLARWEYLLGCDHFAYVESRTINNTHEFTV